MWLARVPKALIGGTSTGPQGGVLVVDEGRSRAHKVCGNHLVAYYVGAPFAVIVIDSLGFDEFQSQIDGLRRSGVRAAGGGLGVLF